MHLRAKHVSRKVESEDSKYVLEFKEAVSPCFSRENCTSSMGDNARPRADCQGIAVPINGVSNGGLNVETCFRSLGAGAAEAASAD